DDGPRVGEDDLSHPTPALRAAAGGPSRLAAADRARSCDTLELSDSEVESDADSLPALSPVHASAAVAAAALASAQKAAARGDTTPPPRGARVHFRNTTFACEYTPVSNFSTLLKAEPYVDLLIKRYAGGKLTSRLQAVLAAGSPVQVSLPGATLVAPSMLPPETVFRSPVVPATPVSGGGRRDALILIAGGTGITPMMQVLEWAAAGGDELHPRPIVYFITSNQTLRHDLLVDELRSLASRMAGDLHLLHAYTRAEDLPAVDECIQPTPKLHLGRIDAATLRAFLPPPPAEVMAGGEASVGQPRVWRVIVSGPSGMFEDVRSHLVEAGHSSELLVELEA
ncbi:hypothetical protein EON68_02815, partial [archaeon]